MTKNHKLARAANDAGFGLLRQFIEYKAELRQCEVVIADRFFPSSKTCSTCNHKNEAVVLGVEWWDCPKCQSHHNRDFNASVNLNRYGRDTLQLDGVALTLIPTQEWCKTYSGMQPR